MNYATMPGFGDPATWGGRSPSDSSPHDYEGPVFFPMTIGMAGARVIVMGRTNGYELDHLDEVLLNGVDILPALDLRAHEDIESYYERHAAQINRAAMQPSTEYDA